MSEVASILAERFLWQRVVSAVANSHHWTQFSRPALPRSGTLSHWARTASLSLPRPSPARSLARSSRAHSQECRCSIWKRARRQTDPLAKPAGPNKRPDAHTRPFWQSQSERKRICSLSLSRSPARSLSNDSNCVCWREYTWRAQIFRLHHPQTPIASSSPPPMNCCGGSVLSINIHLLLLTFIKQPYCTI